LSAKEITQSDLKSMTHEILKSLIENNVTTDVCLYAMDRKFRFEKAPGFIPYKDIPGVFISDSEVDVRHCVEYCNPELITMTFEGDLYYYINERPELKPVTDLNNILKKYGCYYEQGFAWSLAVYPD
jgi:hypothetical protein